MVVLRGAAHPFKIGRRQPEFGEHLLVRYGPAVFERLAGFGDGALFVLADLFVFQRRVTQRSGQRIDDGFASESIVNIA
jgi:hypothetical protein